MTYYKDFTECTYFNNKEWQCRLMAIGWLENGKPYDKGSVYSDVLDKIKLLNKEFRKAFPEIVFRGLHGCSLCKEKSNKENHLDNSCVNLFIPHQGFVFVAPGRIDHYIEEHGYKPPQSFIDSVLECHPPISIQYKNAMKSSNRGVNVPLYNL